MTTHLCWKCDADADVLSVAHGGWVCARHGGDSIAANSTGANAKTAMSETGPLQGSFQVQAQAQVQAQV
jgi:hypothetical protein